MNWQRLILITLMLTVLWLLHAVVYLVSARVFTFHIPYWYIGSAVIAVSFLLANIGVSRFESKLINGFYVLSVTWLGIIFLLFSAAFSYEIIRLVLGNDLPVLLTGFLGFAVLMTIYALFNARHLTTKEYTLPITGLEASVRLVHLSDIHIGTVHQTNFLTRVVNMTNDLKPDLVLMTGDLFDGSAPIQEEMLHPLNDLSAPCFFSYGNHEEYEGLGKVKETVSPLRLQLLDNKTVEWNGLQIIGVNDKQSLRGKTLANILDTLSLNQFKPKILMYHTPVEWDMARTYNIDLMLSGHTHNGQIFPFTLLVRLAFKYIIGLYTEAGKYLHVTPGTGTWGPPMRLGSNNQITLLKLVPKD